MNSGVEIIAGVVQPVQGQYVWLDRKNCLIFLCRSNLSDLSNQNQLLTIFCSCQFSAPDHNRRKR